ncbi:conjugal transfer protein TraG N-terminal domain-containing protein [Zhongshania marina]|uniref:TraG N-terminal Proteobacteria domain-containing protein n=1 Tax=Zhongshania marina TaxID=2304603 RepID=A0A2S4HC25_9GAMM|nr:conjugal transfer protein TraG N-terminal domain-containing protein [Marortus luteolus]POP51552.1 hypothetical protein C0068_16580 [Marortus luteolus]
MIANNYIEIYTLIFSWNIYNAIWEVLVGTGLALIPFIALVAQALMKYNEVRGVQGTVQAVERKLLGMILVMSLCVIPFPNNGVSLATVKYTLEIPDCQVRADATLNTEGDGDNTGEIHDTTFAGMAGSIVHQPVAWYGVNYISTALTHTAISSMSCANNYELMLLRLSEVRIQDPVVRERIQDFYEACYKKTLDRYNENPVAIPNDVSPLDDIDWIGSRIFLNQADEYYRHEEAYMSNMEQYGFTRDEVNRDSDAGADPVSGANPSCREIWEGEANGVNPALGLRDVILDAIPEDEVGDVTQDWQDWGHFVVTEGAIAPVDSGDMLIKMILEADALNLNTSTQVDLGNDFDTDRSMGKKILDMVSNTFGMFAGAKQFFEINTLKQMAKIAGPMILAIVQMIIVFAAPFLMVLTGYKFETFFSLALTYFSFEFINVIWATAFWFDNHILDIYLSKSQGLDTYTNTLIALIISAGNIFLMPLLWLGLMAYAGGGMVRGLAAAGGGAGGGAAGVAGSGGGAAGAGLARGASSVYSKRQAARAKAKESSSGGGKKN